ncbi:hypothetical protein Dip510_001443 [Elusimicrobium posterum]|uniref:hypothetical protein n=1 Tax=Elusimicrobium posterum TaxID=3116653 RepID=UPI003C749DF8
MKKNIVILASILFMAACATTAQLTSEEQVYLDSIQNETNKVVIVKADIADAWGRANSYVAKNSSMKIQTANDHLIDTYNPTNDNSAYSITYGYRVTKTPVDGGYEVEITCLRNASGYGGLAKNQCPRNEKIFSNYLRTGKLPYPNLIAK